MLEPAMATRPFSLDTKDILVKTDQSLPPEWESTFLTYLLLPGLCAFFLFLLIIIVAFRLIKTNRSSEHRLLNTGSFVEQSYDTSIYEVINENPQESEIHAYEERIVPHTDYRNNLLQVSLPSLSSTYQLQTGYDTIQTRRPITCGIGVSSVGIAHRKEGVIENHVTCTQDDIPYVWHTKHEATNSDGRKFIESQCTSHTNMEYYLEDPIYESLDKSWRKSCLKINQLEHENEHDNDSVCPTICASGNNDLRTRDGIHEATVEACNRSDAFCILKEPKICDNYSSCLENNAETSHKIYQPLIDSKPPIYGKTKKSYPDTKSAEDPDVHSAKSIPGAKRAVCKLSIFLDNEDASDSSITKVKHYYYTIGNTNEVFEAGLNTILIDRLDSTQLLLGLDNETKTPSNNTPCYDSVSKYPLKLEPLKPTASIVDLMVFAEKSAPLPKDSTRNVQTFKRLSESCQNLPRNVPCILNNETTQIKKSQSFKESVKYKKSSLSPSSTMLPSSSSPSSTSISSARSRKYSLGTYTPRHHKSLKEIGQAKYNDGMEVARILARLGPLPPTPRPVVESDADHCISNNTTTTTTTIAINNNNNTITNDNITIPGAITKCHKNYVAGVSQNYNNGVSDDPVSYIKKSSHGKDIGNCKIYQDQPHRFPNRDDTIIVSVTYPKQKTFVNVTKVNDTLSENRVSALQEGSRNESIYSMANDDQDQYFILEHVNHECCGDCNGNKY